MQTRLALLDGGRAPTGGEAGSVRLPGPHPETGERNRRMALQAFHDQPVPGPPREYVGYGRHIPKVRWPDNARVAINLVLNYEEGSEYTHPAVRIPVIPATQSGAKLPPHPKEACHPIRTKAAPHRSPIGAQRRLGSSG